MSNLRFLTAGESHGKGLTVIIEGMVAGLPLTEDGIAADLLRRQGGYGRGKRQQIETDRAEITGGVRHGLTMGSPISLWIPNADHANANWQVRMATEAVSDKVERVTLLRPGHADMTGTQKYGFDDVRPILERSSARETAARVAAGAVARALLREIDIEVHSQTVAIGDVDADTAGPPVSAAAETASPHDWAAVDRSPVRVADPTSEERMIAAIDAAREAHDSLGGVFEVRASGVPIGLGSHVQWDRRLDAAIGQAMLSINAVKGVEVGDAFASARLPGSQVHDAILPDESGGRHRGRHEQRRRDRGACGDQAHRHDRAPHGNGRPLDG